MVALGASTAAMSLPLWAQPSAASKADILIGRSTALTGGMAPFLAPLHEGQEAAIADANAKGGIGGRKIRLVSLDDGFDPRRTLENAKQLNEKDGVLALLGVSGTSQVMTLLPYLAQAKLPLIGVYTGSPAIRAQQHPYLFTTRASYADELVKIVRNLVAVQSSRIGVGWPSKTTILASCCCRLSKKPLLPKAHLWRAHMRWPPPEKMPATPPKPWPPRDRRRCCW